MLIAFIVGLVLVQNSVQGSSGNYSNQKWRLLQRPPGVSQKCFQDSENWLKGIVDFFEEFGECLEQYPNCSKALQAEMLNDVYALKQLDAFGHLPSGILDGTLTSVGSSYECREVSSHSSYKTQFCYMQLMIGKHANCSKMLVPIRSAVCMPDSCSEAELPILFNHYALNPLFTYCGAICVPEHVPESTFFWIYMSILGIIVAWVLLATVTEYVLVEVYEAKPNKSAGMRVLLCSSLYSNANSILDTSPAREGHLKSLDCIRFMSMSWVVAGHVNQGWLNNDAIIRLGNTGDPFFTSVITNAFFSVDTFFVLSGLLVSYLFFKMKPKLSTIKSPFTWILFYVHRYLRLTPPYVLLIGFVIAVGPHVVGPQSIVDSDNLAEVAKVCNKYWYQNVLYISNFNPNHNCYGISWYLTADTQMYLVAPVFLVGLYFSHWIGLGLVIAACAGSTAATFGILYHYDLPATVVTGDKNAVGFMNKLYIQPWIRCPPYLIGLYFGYLLVVFKNRKIRMHPLIAIALWMFWTAVALACVFGPHSYFDHHQSWGKFVRAFYYSFSRIGWALSICWVIVANYRGWGGPIAKFMDYPLWQPLGRLSYCAYLVHYVIIYWYQNLMDQPLHLASMWQTYVYYAIPVTACAYFAAFWWSCVCEIPFIRLEKIGIDAITKGMMPRKQPPPQKEEKENIDNDDDTIRL